ncbi:MAG: outer membrane protein assembly factor BamC [Methylococcaceae bacterium]|nr:outer membrane protein assembly factor BamC [Methylococcaceae bacterium]
MKKIYIILLIAILNACASAPDSFNRNKAGWITIELQNKLTKEEVWGKVADSLKERDMEFDKIDKDVGYLRTAWNYNITKNDTYATRIIIDFSSNGKTLRIKSEARYQTKEGWIEGYDTEFTQTIKDEITAIVGQY